MLNTSGRAAALLSAATITLLFLVLSTSTAVAQGGPPMLTDDPGTPGNGWWEVNVLSTFERNRDGFVVEAPLLDINYGIGNRLQLKFEVPWVIQKATAEPAKMGLGNSMFGVKWRFLDEERHGIDMSMYPQVEFNNPTRSVDRGLAERGLRFFLPLEAKRTIGPVEVNGEIGYRFVPSGTDELEYGVAVGRTLSKRFELIGELHGSALSDLRADELFVNAGSRIRINRHASFLVSAGRSIRTPGATGPQYIATVGLQLVFEHGLFTKKNED